MEAWLDKVMWSTLPDCNGARFVRPAAVSRSRERACTTWPAALRLAPTHFSAPSSLPFAAPTPAAMCERDSRRLELLLGIASTTSLQRRSGTLSAVSHSASGCRRRSAPDHGNALRSRRAEHRASPEGQREYDRDARELRDIGNPVIVWSTTKTPSARPTTSWRWARSACTRKGRCARHAQRRAQVQGVAHRAVLSGKFIATPKQRRQARKNNHRP